MGRITLAALVLATVGAAGRAAEAPPDLTAAVRAVTGTVEWRPSADQPWAPAQVGQQLPEGADVRTGFRAACLLEVRGSRTRMDPLSVVRIGELREVQGRVRTRLYMKQGSAQAAVDKGTAENDFAIITPSATLAVRGTDTVHVTHFGPFGSLFWLTHAGQYGLTGPLGQFLTLDPGQQTNDQLVMPIAFLQWLRLLQVMDPWGFEPDEVLASSRRGTTWPIPPDGPGGPPWNFFTNIRPHGRDHGHYYDGYLVGDGPTPP